MTRPLLEPTFASSAPPPNYHPSPTTTTSSGNWWPYSGAKDFNSNVFLIVIFLVCALVCGLALNWTIRFFFRWWKADQSGEAKAPTSVALQRRPPPTLVYSSGVELAGMDAACAICLSEFADGESVRVLPSCRHGFHVKCIEAWLASHASCPTCRAEADPEMPHPAN